MRSSVEAEERAERAARVERDPRELYNLRRDDDGGAPPAASDADDAAPSYSEATVASMAAWRPFDEGNGQPEKVDASRRAAARARGGYFLVVKALRS